MIIHPYDCDYDKEMLPVVYRTMLQHRLSPAFCNRFLLLLPPCYDRMLEYTDILTGALYFTQWQETVAIIRHDLWIMSTYLDQGGAWLQDVGGRRLHIWLRENLFPCCLIGAHSDINWELDQKADK